MLPLPIAKVADSLYSSKLGLSNHSPAGVFALQNVRDNMRVHHQAQRSTPAVGVYHPPLLPPTPVISVQLVDPEHIASCEAGVVGDGDGHGT